MLFIKKEKPNPFSKNYIILNGKSPRLGGILVENNMEYAAPFSPLGLFTTSPIHLKERIEWITSFDESYCN